MNYVTPYDLQQSFGVVGDGIADDTTGINNALNAAPNVCVQMGPGPYKITTLDLVGNQKTLEGVGRFQTRLISDSLTAPMIRVGPSFYNGIKGLYLTRTVTAQPGADGITYLPGTSELQTIEDVYVEKQHVGFRLGPCNSGRLKGIVADKCESDGVLMQNTASSSVMQWNIDLLEANQNKGWGFRVQGVNGPIGQFITLSTWRAINTWANTLGGTAVIGTPQSRIAGPFASHCFWGSDDHWGFFCQNAIRVGLDFCNVELIGMMPTGPNGMAPSGGGFGIYAMDTVSDISANHVRVNQCASTGFASGAPETRISNGRFFENGKSPTSGQRDGIYLGPSVTESSVIGTRSSGHVGFGLTTLKDNVQLIGNNFNGNTLGPIQAIQPLTSANSPCKGNLPVSLNN